MDKQDCREEVLAILWKMAEDPMCQEFVLWVDSLGQREALANTYPFKLCLASLLVREWSLDKAKEFLMGEIA